jgi:phosphoenolpyruvate carboxylase
VLAISGYNRLMGSNSSRDSVKLREKIVLPLIAIQQFALMNLRNPDAGSKGNELKYQKLVIRSMFGIINAARNSA